MPGAERRGIDGAKTQHGPSTIVPVAAELRVGSQVAGYRIERVIGRGGMGVVYAATHLHLGRAVAVKVLIPELVESRDFRDRFLRESRTAASINHPNIVTVYDAGEADGLLYIAMQYVDGTDLGELLASQGPQEPRRAVAILHQIAAALDAAHARGVVHRDVKPANVLLDTERCYLSDFGLAKSISSGTALTAKGQFVGTVHYMAPEQIKAGDVDARTDVYALGCLAYHVFSGRVPFERDSEISEVYAHMEDPPPSLVAERPDLQVGVDAVLTTALAKSKEDRYAACGELVAALEAALEGGEDTAASGTGDAPVATLLVVAGEPRTRGLVRASVKPGRLRVLEAADVRAASDAAGKERPELAVVDWDGTGTAAHEICAALRALPELSQIKVLALVGREPAAGRKAIGEGADDYVVKPFSPLQLLYKVRDLVGVDLVRV